VPVTLDCKFPLCSLTFRRIYIRNRVPVDRRIFKFRPDWDMTQNIKTADCLEGKKNVVTYETEYFKLCEEHECKHCCECKAYRSEKIAKTLT
jgi:hypothetical protein